MKIMKQLLSIGIVGGMSPESTVIYYEHIIRSHQRGFHDHSYPRIIVASVSFQQYIDWQHEGNWEEIARGLKDEFAAVAAAGADFAVLATNTMHKVLPLIESPIPILNIMDVVGRYAKTNNIGSVGLTGTKFTMSEGFYARGLEARGLGVVIPNESQQEMIHRAIYTELIEGKVEAASVREFAKIAEDLAGRGAEAILLGCTELGLLAPGGSTRVKMIDTTLLHAEAAWRASIGESDVQD